MTGWLSLDVTFFLSERSTVPETILARRHGLRVLALSMFTNMGCGLEAEGLSHAHTLATAQAAGERAVPLLEAIVAGLTL